MTDSLWAELEAIEARDAARHDCCDFLGGCPICGRTDACLNVGRETALSVGSKMARWRDEDDRRRKVAARA